MQEILEMPNAPDSIAEISTSGKEVITFWKLEHDGKFHLCWDIFIFGF